MCGDLEEDETEAEQIYAAFMQAAHAQIHDAVGHRGGTRSRLKEGADAASDDPAGRLSDDALHGYMDGLLGDLLNACLKDGRSVSGSDRYRVLASQAIVMARVAGFLAGQLDPRTDPLRTSMEALMAGYGSR